MSLFKKIQIDPSKEMLYVLLLASIQFAHIVDFVVMMPLGPTFMQVFQISPTQFALLVSSYNFSAAAAGILNSVIADRFDRKNALIFSFVGFILGTFFCAISESYFQLLMARIFAGAFGGILNALILAIVADLVPYTRRGKAMGIVMSSFSVANVLGVPIALAIADISTWQNTFHFVWLFSLIILMSAIIILPNIDAHLTRPEKYSLKSYWLVFKNPEYLKGHLCMFVLSFSAFMIIPFISPYVVKNVGLDSNLIKYQYLIAGACTVLTANLFGRMTDKFGPFKMYFYLVTLSFIPILLMTHMPPVSYQMVFFITAIFMAIVSGRFIPAMTLISQMPTNQDRGAYMGILIAVRSFSTALATYVAGWIMTESIDGKLVGYNTVGYLSVATAAFAIYLGLRVHQSIKI